MHIEELKEVDYKQVEEEFKNIFKNKKIKDIKKNNPFTKFYILKNINTIIGIINYDLIYERVELINIEIKKNYQGFGYSKILMDQMIKDSKNKTITLEVNINNSVAIKLYEKYNFKKVSIRNNYYNGMDAILMERV